MLAVALNTPGNVVFGGGLALAAVAPVPLCIATLDRFGFSWSLL